MVETVIALRRLPLVLIALLVGLAACSDDKPAAAPETSENAAPPATDPEPEFVIPSDTSHTLLKAANALERVWAVGQRFPTVEEMFLPCDEVAAGDQSLACVAPGEYAPVDDRGDAPVGVTVVGGRAVAVADGGDRWWCVSTNGDREERSYGSGTDPVALSEACTDDAWSR